MKKKFYNSAAAVLLAVCMPVSALAMTPTRDNDREIDKTGPRSYNKICDRNWHKVEVENETELDLDNWNPQEAFSGDALVRHNTTGGAARTGDAVNDSLVDVEVSVDNSASTTAALNAPVGTTGDRTIENTGPKSYNKICDSNMLKQEIENETELDIEVDNPQYSRSGNARVSGNTTGGGATSGDAENISTTRVSASVRSSSPAPAKSSSKSYAPSSDTTIRNTGPKSYNKVESNNWTHTEVENETEVNIENDNEQYAVSGSARVSGNTTGGSATSGDATNVSTTQVTLKVNN